MTSSSSRRTWIEMSVRLDSKLLKTVVLLAEDVDRNTDIDWLGVGKNVSSSSRRTWIEI